MKDAILTVRLPSATRVRLQALAKREGRSLSAQVERLIEQGMEVNGPAQRVRRHRGTRSLAGTLSGGRVPTLADFRAVRSRLSTSLTKLSRADAEPRR